jgi:PAS domain S-box-containing protein
MRVSQNILFALAGTVTQWLPGRRRRAQGGGDDCDRRMQWVIDTAPDGIVILGAAGRVQYANAAAERLLGVSMSRLCGRGLDACVDLARMTPAAAALLDGDVDPDGAPRRSEVTLVTTAGRELEVELSVTAWHADAGCQRALFLRDIAERRRLQGLLEQRAQRADVANEAKTRFLAAMSHEIRTPLNAILNMNELLLESALDEEQRSYAATAGESARALLSIVNSVLDFSKIESGRVDPTPRASDPEEIVRSVVDLLAARAHARGLELTVFCDPTVPERIETDPGLVRQILLNLLGNAIRFTDEGMVQLRIQRDHAARLLHITVRDTGVGIPQHEQTILFTEFKQAHGPGGRPQGGSGLGLAISRRLARLLGGDITLASAPGEGSAFTLSLPLPAEVPAGKRAAGSAALAQWQVRLYADNALLVDALAEQLRAYGIAVEPLGKLPAGLPAGCCGAVQMVPRQEPSRSRVIALYRIGSRCDWSPDRCVAGLRIPVTPGAFVHALCDALQKEAAVQTGATDDIADRVAHCATGALPILLAEDSRANQLVATSILGKAGFRVDVVENGLQAVAAVNRRNYSLVLMDLAMPDMDGIEATGCIRALPGKRGRVPIVAMTANAFDEDRRRCLEAGMDGYLSKPIERRALFEAVLEWIDTGLAGHLPAVPLDPAGPRPHAPGWSLPAVSTKAGGYEGNPDAVPAELDEGVVEALVAELSEALMPDVVATFVAEAGERISAIEQAAANGDCARAGDQAHALKGGAATFGAAALRDQAIAIEAAARGADLDALRAHVRGLRSRGDAVLGLLRSRFGDATGVP